MRLPNLPLQLLISDFTDTSGLETWFSSFKGQTDYEVRDLSITTGDIVAFSHCLCRIIGTKSDGERVNMWTRQTICFRKIDGQWLIVHSHLSVPFYMTANHKTAVDLTPD